MLAARRAGQRPAPGRDDKIVAAWNGLAVAALAETGAYFFTAPTSWTPRSPPRISSYGCTWTTGRDCRVPARTGRPGRRGGVGGRHADVAEGFLALASVTGEGVWLEFAGFLLDQVIMQFTDPESGALYDTAADAERLIRRPQDPTDNATPSGWSAAAGALLSYAAQTGAEPHRTGAERALGVVKALGPRAPRFIGWGSRWRRRCSTDRVRSRSWGRRGIP